MKKYIKEIVEIIKTDEFQRNISSDFYNFPNQKLEFHLRNNLVRIFNSNNDSKERAFAEHPRYSYKLNSKNKRVSIDFSICKGKDVKFTMELKYNFTNDNSQFKKYASVIERNFLNRIWNDKKENIHAFLLIVCEIDRTELAKFQDFWKVNDMNQYQTRKKPEIWKQNIEDMFDLIKIEHNCLLEKVSNEVKNEDLKANLYYYLLYKNKEL